MQRKDHLAKNCVTTDQKELGLVLEKAEKIARDKEKWGSNVVMALCSSWDNGDKWASDYRVITKFWRSCHYCKTNSSAEWPVKIENMVILNSSGQLDRSVVNISGSLRSWLILKVIFISPDLWAITEHHENSLPIIFVLGKGFLITLYLANLINWTLLCKKGILWAQSCQKWKLAKKGIRPFCTKAFNWTNNN